MYQGHIIVQDKNMFDIADIYGDRRGSGLFGHYIYSWLTTFSMFDRWHNKTDEANFLEQVFNRARSLKSMRTVNREELLSIYRQSDRQFDHPAKSL
jgi:hypothetical protein